MYIDGDALIQLAETLASVGALLTLIIGVYKVYARDKRQSQVIAEMQSEQTLICYGVLACLKGLKEQGCNGPVTDALTRMEKHLNKAAHETVL